MQSSCQRCFFTSSSPARGAFSPLAKVLEVKKHIQKLDCTWTGPHSTITGGDIHHSALRPNAPDALQIFQERGTTNLILERHFQGLQIPFSGAIFKGSKCRFPIHSRKPVLALNWGSHMGQVPGPAGSPPPGMHLHVSMPAVNQITRSAELQPFPMTSCNLILKYTLSLR